MFLLSIYLSLSSRIVYAYKIGLQVYLQSIHQFIHVYSCRIGLQPTSNCGGYAGAATVPGAPGVVSATALLRHKAEGHVGRLRRWRHLGRGAWRCARPLVFSVGGLHSHGGTRKARWLISMGKSQL